MLDIIEVGVVAGHQVVVVVVVDHIMEGGMETFVGAEDVVCLIGLPD